MVRPLNRIGRITRGVLRKPDGPPVTLDQQQLSALGNLVPPRTRPPARWVTDEAYVEMARRLLTVMGAKVGGRNRIAQTMARSMGASKDPGRQLEQLRAEYKQVDQALGELRKVQGQLAEQTGEIDGIEPLADIARRAREPRP
jgi:hypothetical protein